MRKAYREDKFPAPAIIADPRPDVSERAQKLMDGKLPKHQEHRSSTWGVHQQDEQS